MVFVANTLLDEVAEGSYRLPHESTTPLQCLGIEQARCFIAMHPCTATKAPVIMDGHLLMGLIRALRSMARAQWIQHKDT